jgi:hypothetical protein
MAFSRSTIAPSASTHPRTPTTSSSGALVPPRFGHTSAQVRSTLEHHGAQMCSTPSLPAAQHRRSPSPLGHLEEPQQNGFRLSFPGAANAGGGCGVTCSIMGRLGAPPIRLRPDGPLVLRCHFVIPSFCKNVIPPPSLPCRVVPAM